MICPEVALAIKRLVPYGHIGVLAAMVWDLEPERLVERSLSATGP